MSYDFLFASFDAGGSVPTLATAVRRLRARGHNVRVLLDDSARPDVERAGGDFVPWTRAPNRADHSADADPIKDWMPSDPGGDLLRLLDELTIGPAAAYAADTLAELNTRPADVVVSSDLMFGPLIAAKAAGVPVVSLATNISIFVPIPGVPPVGPGLAPAVTDEERAMAAGVAGWFADRINERLPVLNAARAHYGLPALSEGFAQPREADLHLIATSQAFDFPAESLPQGMSYVGPLLDPPAWVTGWESPWSPDDARPLVLVAMSTSFQNQLPTIQALLDAVDRLPVRMLVTLGPALDGKGLRVPDNAVVRPAAPHDLIMEQAAVVVTHCGHGTIMRALRQGRPMLCLPMGRDQNDNAARVAARGAGIRLTRDADAGSLRTALTSLLEDASYADAAAALGRAIATSEPADALVDALESLAARRRRQSAA